MSAKPDPALQVRIRPAHPGEGERLREIATAALGFWGYDPARVREWTATLDLSPARLGTADAYVAEVGGRPWVEVMSAEDGVCVLEHLWVEPGLIRRGIGSALFRVAADRAREQGRR